MVPQIKHLRPVGDRLLVGAQPSADAYPDLAARGVSLVVDLRGGTLADPRADDPQALAALGVGYECVPVHDGWTPSPNDVERILALIASAEGVVFVHCGGGVGRSGCVASVYARAQRMPLSFRQTFGGGVPSLEQLWYARRGNRLAHPGVIVSRLLDAPRQSWGWARARARARKRKRP